MDTTKLQGYETAEEKETEFNVDNWHKLQQFIHTIRRFCCPVCGYICTVEEMIDHCPTCNYPEFSFKSYQLNEGEAENAFKNSNKKVLS